MPQPHCLPVEYVRQCLKYVDGRVFWLVRPRSHFKDDRIWKLWNTKYSNREAGSYVAVTGGYRCMVALDQIDFYRSRLVWVPHNDQWVDRLDHENRDALDDRIENLRPCTQKQNIGNRTKQSNNKSGYKGVSWSKKRNLWMAQIKRNGRQTNLGGYVVKEDAARAYDVAARKEYGEFAVLNFP